MPVVLADDGVGLPIADPFLTLDYRCTLSGTKAKKAGKKAKEKAIARWEGEGGA